MSEETPIYDFNKFKAALERLGYTIGEAKPYTPLEVADVNLSNIQSGEVEMTWTRQCTYNCFCSAEIGRSN